MPDNTISNDALKNKLSELEDELSRAREEIEKLRSEISWYSQKNESFIQEHEKAAGMFQCIVDTMRDGIMIEDEKDTIIYANNALARTLGFDDALSLFKKNSSEFIRSISDEALDQKTGFYEAVLKTVPGDEIPVLVTGSLFKTGDKFIGILSVIKNIHDIKTTQKALFKSEENYRTLVQNVSSVIMRMDVAGKITFINEYGIDLFGYGESELIGKNIIGTLLPERDSSGYALDEMIEDMIKDPLRYKINENENTCKNGRRVWIAWTNSGVYDSAGNLIEVLAVGNDISTRKHVEESLKKSEERFRYLVELSPFPISIIDKHGILEYINPKFREIFGYSKEEIPDSEAWFEKAFPDAKYREDSKKLWESVLNNYNESFLLKRLFEVTCKGGDIKDIEFRPVSIDDNRHFIMYVDLTERLKAESALHESEEKLKTILNSATEAIFTKDKSRKYVFVNKAFSEVFGLSAEEIVGKTAEALYDESRIELINKRDELALAGLIVENDTRITASNGENRTYHVIRFPLKNKEGSVYGIGCICRNVTALRDAERDREDFKNQLFRSQKMEAIGQFAGGIANEFNEMLSVIIGNASLARNEIKEGDLGYEELIRISDAAKRSRELSMNLLTLSSKNQLSLTSYPVSKIIDNIAAITERTMQKKIKVETVIEKDIPDVRTNIESINQALINIVNNAGDAMPDGGTIRIECRAVEFNDESPAELSKLVPGGYCLISITDTGKGMSEEALSNIFEPFFTTKEPGKGAGLGLSVTFGIVKSHGGHIFAESKPGTGSSFNIYLPFSDSKSDS